MANDTKCAGSEAPRLIFACSGASNLGRISDLAARALTKDGVGKMYCLAGIGGRVSGIIENTRAASRIFAIDGCDQDCAKKCLELAGFNQVEQLRLQDLGMEKGKTPVTKKTISLVADRIRQMAG
jgi:uncharacterized metal-binding protein